MVDIPPTNIVIYTSLFRLKTHKNHHNRLVQSPNKYVSKVQEIFHRVLPY